MKTVYDPKTARATTYTDSGEKVFTAVHAPYVTDPADPFGFEADAAAEQAFAEAAARAEAQRYRDYPTPSGDGMGEDAETVAEQDGVRATVYQGAASGLWTARVDAGLFGCEEDGFATRDDAVAAALAMLAEEVA